MLPKSETFLNFQISQGSVDEMEIFVVYALSYESTGERILKIGPHFSELFTNINGIVFLSAQPAHVDLRYSICQQ